MVLVWGDSQRVAQELKAGGRSPRGRLCPGDSAALCQSGRLVEDVGGLRDDVGLVVGEDGGAEKGLKADGRRNQMI